MIPSSKHIWNWFHLQEVVWILSKLLWYHPWFGPIFQNRIEPSFHLDIFSSWNQNMSLPESNIISKNMYHISFQSLWTSHLGSLPSPHGRSYSPFPFRIAVPEPQVKLGPRNVYLPWRYQRLLFRKLIQIEIQRCNSKTMESSQR